MAATPADVTTHSPPTRPDPARELRTVALERFASAGFAGTSLQQIADAAGYSKSSVLYHFASKDALLEAALAPALDRLEQILEAIPELTRGARERRAFVERFVDFLFEFRLEAHIFINQGQALVDVPVFVRANETIRRLAHFLRRDFNDLQESVRFSVALGGAAYTLVMGVELADIRPSDDELRGALIDIVSRLLEATGKRGN